MADQAGPSRSKRFRLMKKRWKIKLTAKTQEINDRGRRAADDIDANFEQHLGIHNEEEEQGNQPVGQVALDANISSNLQNVHNFEEEVHASGFNLQDSFTFSDATEAQGVIQGGQPPEDLEDSCNNFLEAEDNEILKQLEEDNLELVCAFEPDGDDRCSISSNASSQANQSGSSADSNIEISHHLSSSDDESDHEPPGPPNNPHNDSSDENSENSDVEADHLDFNHESLRQVLGFGQNMTVGEALIIHCATAIRHNMSYEALLDLLRNTNLMLRVNQLPSQKKGLWRKLQRSSHGIVEHAYCGNCQHSLGLRINLPPFVVCANEFCQWSSKKASVPYFVTLNFKKSLKNFLSTPGIFEELQFRENRVKKHPGNIEDVYDSKCYKELRLGEFDLTYSINADGVKLTKTQTAAWPLFVTICELPPHLRPVYIILAGLYVGKKEPLMNVFLKPFVEQANEVSEQGISWRPHGAHGDVVRSKFFPLTIAADARARASILSMSQCNGYFSCTWCDIRGIYSAKNMRFPAQVIPPLCVPELRTHDGMLRMMCESVDGDVRGHKGPSEIMNLQHFRLDTGFVTDDLHPVFEGVVKSHTKALMDFVCPKYKLIKSDVINCIDRKMKTIQTPSCISRKTQFQSFKDFEKFKGSQGRDWLFYYGPVCLKNVGIPDEYVHHFEMLSEAIYRLSKRSISPGDICVARRLIQKYVVKYEKYFGLDQMFYNFHVLTHMADCVENRGNLWANSTFPTESANFRLIKRLTSPIGALDQIINRYLIDKLLHKVADGENLSPQVYERLHDLIEKKRLVSAVMVKPNYYVIGKGRRRLLTIHEKSLLPEEVVANHVTEYGKALFNRIEYRSREKVNADGHSDDSVIVTTTGMHADITSIVVVEEDDNSIVGAFVNLYRTEGHLTYAKHIKELGAHTPSFIPASEIDGPSIRIKLYGSKFAAGVANWWAID